MLIRSLKPQLIESIPKLRTPMKIKVWVEAYGCSASMADSEMIRGLLRAADYELATRQNEGALNLIVTCSVKDTTEHRMISRIKSLKESGKPLIIAGCLPKADREKVELLCPTASLLGPHSIERTAGIMRSTLSGRRSVELEDSISDKINIPRIRLNPVVSIVEIASGCMSECSFCQTKLAKGWVRSYRIGDILKQIQEDVQNGCKEIWLTSTDNGCYGRDTGSTLVDLLKACCSIDKDYKIRLGMMNPMYLPEMQDDLIDIFYSNDKLFKFLHIPIESGSDRILRKMKRGHTSRIFLDSVRAFRKKIPEMTISTDVIVGFPSETEDDFNETIRLIEKSEPDIINSARYSARPGTESAKWRDGRISSDVAKTRSEQIHILMKKIGKKRNSLWRRWRGEVLIDEISDKLVQGRNYAYKPVTILDADPNITLGSKIHVEVCNFSNFSLKARTII
jgi:threonylcarbamoyladenosine tRNA methylthiotransferase CDKAL1